MSLICVTGHWLWCWDGQKVDERRVEFWVQHGRTCPKWHLPKRQVKPWIKHLNRLKIGFKSLFLTMMFVFIFSFLVSFSKPSPIFDAHKHEWICNICVGWGVVTGQSVESWMRDALFVYIYIWITVCLYISARNTICFYNSTFAFYLPRPFSNDFRNLNFLLLNPFYLKICLNILFGTKKH